MRTDEVALVKMAVKRAQRAHSIIKGYNTIQKWQEKHPNRSIKEILFCYRKAVKRGLIEDNESLFFNTIKLHFHTYRNDELNPCRTVNFEISMSCLQNYLYEVKDCRTEEEFFETYDSDEAEELYSYAEDDNRIIKESVIYSDDFEAKYDNSEYVSKEEYFWNEYIKA